MTPAENAIQNATAKLRDEAKAVRTQLSSLKREMNRINEIANADILKTADEVTALKAELRALESRRLQLRQIVGS